MGIDWGMGQVNIDKETGIRYGIISANDVNPDALDVGGAYWEDSTYNAAYTACVEEIQDILSLARVDMGSALRRIERDFGDRAARMLREAIAEGGGLDEYDISDIASKEMEMWEAPYGSEYGYNDGEYVLHLDTDNDIWVFKSPYMTQGSYCSPCAPGAVTLGSAGEDNWAYALGPDWFDEENPMPYEVVAVKDYLEMREANNG